MVRVHTNEGEIMMKEILLRFLIGGLIVILCICCVALIIYLDIFLYWLYAICVMCAIGLAYALGSLIREG